MLSMDQRSRQTWNFYYGIIYPNGSACGKGLTVVFNKVTVRYIGHKTFSSGYILQEGKIIYLPSSNKLSIQQVACDTQHMASLVVQTVFPQL